MRQKLNLVRRHRKETTGTLTENIFNHFPPSKSVMPQERKGLSQSIGCCGEPLLPTSWRELIHRSVFFLQKHLFSLYKTMLNRVNSGVFVLKQVSSTVHQATRLPITTWPDQQPHLGRSARQAEEEKAAEFRSIFHRYNFVSMEMSCIIGPQAAKRVREMGPVSMTNHVEPLFLY